MKLKISILFITILFPLSSIAQTANSLTINPTNGSSTLDQLRPSKTDTLEYDFPSGFRCRLGGGDAPSLVFYGDTGSLGSGASDNMGTSNNSGLSGTRYGAAIVVPLYRGKTGNCDEAMKMYNVLNKLEIAEKMVTTGAMTNEEYIELTKQLKKEVFGMK